MKNIHLLDKEQANTIHGMIYSESIDDIRLALSIINNADFTDYQTSCVISSLISELYYLRFDYDLSNRIFFWYDSGSL